MIFPMRLYENKYQMIFTGTKDMSLPCRLVPLTVSHIGGGI